MADLDRERWDERHEAAEAAVVGPPLGLTESGLVVPEHGAALDVACGRGGTSVWAARRGMHVVAVDVSPVAIRATERLAAAHDVGHRIDPCVVDLDHGLPSDFGPFDLVMCQRYRQPDLVSGMAAALAPGGVLVLSVLSVVGAARPGRFHAPAGESVRLVDESGLTIVHHTESDGVAVVVGRR